MLGISIGVTMMYNETTGEEEEVEEFALTYGGHPLTFEGEQLTYEEE